MRSLQSIKEEIDRVNIEIQSAERDYDLNRAAELKYGTLLDLQNKLNDTEKRLEKQVVSPTLAPPARRHDDWTDLHELQPEEMTDIQVMVRGGGGGMDLLCYAERFGKALKRKMWL